MSRSLQVLGLLVAMFAITMVGGCRKHRSTVYVPVEVDHNIYTPLGLTVVEISDPDGCIANGSVTQDQLLADLDYEVLTVWLTDVQCNPCYQGLYTVDQLVALAKQVKFRLIVSRTFELNKSKVHYAQIDDDVYIATEIKHHTRHCEWAVRAMNLYLDDQKD